MTKVSRHHKLAVLSHQRGEGSKWVTAYHSSQIVGTREKGKTVNLAKDLALSVDSVEHMARAYITYQTLRTFERENGAQVQSLEFAGLREIRKRLTIKHFATMGQLWTRIEFSVQEGIDYLVWAAEEGASVEAMHRLILDEQTSDERMDEWQRELEDIARRVVNMINSYPVPDLIRLTAQDFLVRIDKVLEVLEKNADEKIPAK